MTRAGANALLVDFTDSRLVRLLVSSYTRPHGGGTWVGGSFEVTNADVRFITNFANRAIHGRRADITIPLDAIRTMTLVHAVGTDIVAIRTDRAVLQVRLWRAAKIAEAVTSAVNTNVRPERPMVVAKASGEVFRRELVAILTAVTGLA